MTTPKAQTFPELTAAIEEFKAYHTSELGDVKSALDDTNTKIAAILVGGAANDNAAPTNDIAAKAALGQFVKSGNHEAMTALSPKAAHQIGVEEDGGYIVPPQLDTTILEAQRDLSPFRRMARVVSTRANLYQQPFNTGGTGSGWVGETDARPETDTSKLTLLEFPAGEVYANPAVTQRMLDDAPINIGQFVIDEIAKQFDAQESAAFLAGDGINKPKGLLTYPTAVTADAVRAFGTIQTVASGGAADVTFEGIIDLIYALKAGYRRKGAFLMNSRTQGAFAKIKDGNGNFMLQQSVALGVPSTIFGFPVETDEGMPDIAAGATPVAFGDFNSGYLINDRVGIKLLRDPYSKKPFVQFYTTKRVGGGLLDSNAIKLLRIAAS